MNGVIPTVVAGHTPEAKANTWKGLSEVSKIAYAAHSWSQGSVSVAELLAVHGRSISVPSLPRRPATRDADPVTSRVPARSAPVIVGAPRALAGPTAQRARHRDPSRFTQVVALTGGGALVIGAVALGTSSVLGGGSEVRPEPAPGAPVAPTPDYFGGGPSVVLTDVARPTMVAPPSPPAGLPAAPPPPAADAGGAAGGGDWPGGGGGAVEQGGSGGGGSAPGPFSDGGDGAGGSGGGGGSSSGGSSGGGSGGGGNGGGGGLLDPVGEVPILGPVVQPLLP